MSSREDSFTPFDAVIAATHPGDPWTHLHGQAPVYSPDYDLLGRILTVTVRAGDTSESGRFAKGIDAWLANEFRRAGFGADEVWPRASRPRVLPRDIAVLLEKLPRRTAEELRLRLPSISAVGPADARVLGRAYDKQVDVCIARWDRGPELLVSTKAQVSSFAKNLPNRFEEAYGDAGNLMGRYPLAAVGFFFVQRSTILWDDPAAFERTVDMMRKLRTDGLGVGYTATGLALVGWDENTEDSEGPTVHVDLESVPDDVRPDRCIARLIDRVLEVTPVVHHVDVRSLRDRRHIAVTEDDSTSAGDQPPEEYDV